MQRSAYDDAWVAQLKVPFLAQLPSLLYEQDRQWPEFVRFKEARDIRMRKEYMLQLRTEDFRALPRFV